MKSGFQNSTSKKENMKIKNSVMKSGFQNPTSKKEPKNKIKLRSRELKNQLPIICVDWELF